MYYRTVACLNGAAYRSNKTSDGIGYRNPCSFTFSIPSTKYYTDDYSKPQISSYLYGYTYSGFATIQQTVDEYILSLYSTTGSVSVMTSVSLMPTGAYLTDDFQLVISSVLGIFYMLSFLYPVSRIVRALVVEKETRVKEGMAMFYIIYVFIVCIYEVLHHQQNVL